MSAIEFSAPTGRTFAAQLYDPTNNTPVGSVIVPNEGVPTRYRVSTGSQTGIIYVVATSTNLRVAGYANLDRPAVNGFSPLFSSYVEAVADLDLSVTVLPASAQQLQRQDKTTLTVYVGETLVAASNVKDANGNLVTLTGRTLRFVIEDERRVELASLEPQVNGASFSATLPSSVTEKQRTLRWALRDRSAGAGNASIVDGQLDVRYAPGRTG